MMSRRQTRNEKKLRRRYKALYALSVAAWLVFVLWVVSIRVQSKDAPQPLKTAERPPVVTTSEVVGYQPTETPAEDYASLDGLQSLGTFKVTAYCGCPTCCGVWSKEHPCRADSDYVQKTSSGTIPAGGRTVAADWSVLPSGKEIVMDGNVYTVEDTGSAVIGNHIDIYMESHEAAKAWGVQHIELYEEAK